MGRGGPSMPPPMNTGRGGFGDGGRGGYGGRSGGFSGGRGPGESIPATSHRAVVSCLQVLTCFTLVPHISTVYE